MAAFEIEGQICDCRLERCKLCSPDPSPKPCKCGKYRDMLEDVVNELDLSEVMIAEHGQHGTAPSELVKIVLESKDREIGMLKRGMVAI